MDKNGLSAFLLGLGVGVGIGMLFAPKSGEETRELIKNKANEGGEYLKQRGADIKQTATGWVEKGREALNRQKDNLADAMKSDRARFAKFFHCLLAQGVYLAPSQFEAGFISTAHTTSDIDQTWTAAAKILRRL